MRRCAVVEAVERSTEMVTRVHPALDSIFPNGPLIDPTSVHITYAGPAGLAVWRGEGRPIITTANLMERFTDLHDTFGRDTLLNIANRPFWNSNDVQRGEIDFQRGRATPMATAASRIRSSSGSQTSPTWTPSRTGGRGTTAKPASISGSTASVSTSIPRPTQRWMCSRSERRPMTSFPLGQRHDARPDGFALLPPCVAVVDHHDINPLG